MKPSQASRSPLEHLVSSTEKTRSELEAIEERAAEATKGSDENMWNPLRRNNISPAPEKPYYEMSLHPSPFSRHGIDWSYPYIPVFNHYPKAISPIRKIGAGSFSSVVLAKDRELGKIVALKLTRKSKSKYVPNLPQLVEDELDILKKLPKHPGLCQYFRTIDFPGMVIVELEYVPGIDLHTYLDGKPASERFAKKIMKQAIEAFQSLETAGVYHMDIKPGNIMLNPATGSIKIIDFGFSKLSNEPVEASLEQPFAEVGSIEVASTNRYTPKSAMVWLLGSTLYQIVSGGHCPFRKYNTIPFSETLNKKAYKIMPHITDEVLGLIEAKPEGFVSGVSYPISTLLIGRLDVINRRFALNRFWSRELHDLFKKIFVPEHDRLSLNELLRHPWFST